jgi:hypothetical protein
MRSIYQRRPEDLKAHASLYWPQELREQAVSTQVMTRLLETQETFVSILKVADASPTSWEQVLSGCSLAPNLFLKHLMILADVSSEILKRDNAPQTECDAVRMARNQLRLRVSEHQPERYQ